MIEERERFVLEALQNGANVSQLCRQYGISRSCGNKWVRRFSEEGRRGLQEQSRRPKHLEHTTSEEIICAVISYRLDKPTRGAGKIQGYLESKYASELIPSVRTINRILDRSGLIVKNPRRSKLSKEPTWKLPAYAANEVWTADGKGWWRTKDGKRCEPLTIRDAYSRYMLAIKAMPTLRKEAVKDCFRSCFEEYGLPQKILTDNGVPFAAVEAPLKLSSLSAWWIKLGIDVHLTPPGKPQCNGGHERMHLDLAKEVESNPASNLSAQQRILDEWREEFNYERKHDALRRKTPSEIYRVSKRKYDPKEPDYEYPDDFEVRKVDTAGMLFWKNSRIFLSRSLAEQYVGFELLDTKKIKLWYCNLCLGVTDQNFNFPLTPIGVRGSEDTFTSS